MSTALMAVGQQQSHADADGWYSLRPIAGRGPKSAQRRVDFAVDQDVSSRVVKAKRETGEVIAW